MTDIVERLRDHNRHIRGRLIEGLTDLVIDDMVEAADEIERLREALNELLPHASYLLVQMEDGLSKDPVLLRTRIQKARAALGEKE